jgi:hypothetical protein
MRVKNRLTLYTEANKILGNLVCIGTECNRWRNIVMSRKRRRGRCGRKGAEEEEEKHVDDNVLKTQGVSVSIKDRIIFKQVILKKRLVIKTKQYSNK